MSNSNTQSNSNVLDRITVVVRKRPLTHDESDKNVKDVVGTSSNCVVVFEPKQKLDLTKYIKESKFLFDNVFSHEDTNLTIYETICMPLVDKFFEGNKITFFAYGQTGSGKTFTMMGEQVEEGIARCPENDGIQDLAGIQILEKLQKTDQKLEISFYEIYCNKLFDLLNGRAELELLEDAKRIMNVKGLTYFEITSHTDLQHLIAQGMQNRITDSNGVNRQSSRSHSVLEFKLTDANKKMVSKMSFIDLAGSEKGSDVIDMGKQTKFDGAEINKSLLALKECIRALDADKNQVNYRQSKLTLVLRECFIGANCYTTMITQISPTEKHTNETINTLRQASKIKTCNASKKPKELISNPQDDLTSSDTEVQGKLEESSARRTGENKMKFKYKPKSMKQSSDNNNSRNEGSKSSSSLEYNRISGVNPKVNRNFDNNKENIRESKDFSNISTNIGNLSKISSVSTPTTSSINKVGPKGHINSKKEMSHIKNISMDNANALDHNILEYLDNKLIGGKDPSPEVVKKERKTSLTHNIGNGIAKHKGEREKNTTPRDKIKNDSRKSSTHQDGFYDPGKDKFGSKTPQINSINQFNDGYIESEPKRNGHISHLDKYPQSEDTTALSNSENGNDLQNMKHNHESLIDRVLQLEEDILLEHKVQIDHKVEMVKKQMSLYTENEQPESNIYNYVDNLDCLLHEEIKKINEIKSKLESFKTDLKAEREMSEQFKKINQNTKEDNKN